MKNLANLPNLPFVKKVDFSPRADDKYLLEYRKYFEVFLFFLLIRVKTGGNEAPFLDFLIPLMKLRIFLALLPSRLLGSCFCGSFYSIIPSKWFSLVCFLLFVLLFLNFGLPFLPIRIHDHHQHMLPLSLIFMSSSCPMFMHSLLPVPWVSIHFHLFPIHPISHHHQTSSTSLWRKNPPSSSLAHFRILMSGNPTRCGVNLMMKTSRRCWIETLKI